MRDQVFARNKQTQFELDQIRHLKMLCNIQFQIITQNDQSDTLLPFHIKYCVV